MLGKVAYANTILGGKPLFANWGLDTLTNLIDFLIPCVIILAIGIFLASKK